MGGAPSPTLCRLTKRAQKRFEVRGDLQAEVMRAVWKLGEATVEDVRATQRPRSASAYTTIQTVLNRLVDRAVLTRVRKGRTFVYTARIGESEYLAQSIGDRLADASPDARRAALVNLVDDLEPSELDALARRANQIKRARGKA